MKPPLRQPAHDSFLAGLDDNDSDAALLFVECCRQSPALRRWLWRDFAWHAKVRASLAKRLSDDWPSSRIPHPGHSGLELPVAQPQARFSPALAL